VEIWDYAYPRIDSVSTDEIIRWHNTVLNWVYPPDLSLWRQDECDRFNKAAVELDEHLKEPKNFRRSR